MTGRPTTYTEEMGARICEAISVSKQGLRKTLEDDPALPSIGTVLSWRSDIASFSALYARAKQKQIEHMAEDIIDLSNDDTLDPADKRIRVDTLKWLLSKLIPKTYGDKLDLTTGGEAMTVPAHQIDARVSSILMQAAARRQARPMIDVTGLGDEAMKLLE